MVRYHKTILFSLAVALPLGATAQDLEYCMYNNYGTKQLCYISATACQNALSYSPGAQCFAERK